MLKQRILSYLAACVKVSPVLQTGRVDFNLEFMKPTDHLNAFVSQTEGFAWRLLEGVPNLATFELTSQIWQGQPWTHDVVLIVPDGAHDSSTAILYVTGGDMNEPDAREAWLIAERAQVPVALLFHMPNQPLFDRREDDLIAHTFERYLDTGDAEWPLLYPMVRATIRCMDMLQEIDDLSLTRFVVTGASKRGWTTWLTAATGDTRLAGIAPMVIDNLNFPAQMEHQFESWGGYSEQIEDYTSRDLQDDLDDGRKAELVQMMDPINYVDQFNCPILIINGGNDRYWTVDALSLYWDLLPEPKRCLIVPNVGHILGDKVQMVETLSAFAHACAKGTMLPDPATGRKRVWTARSNTLDFRDSDWQSDIEAEVGRVNVARLEEFRLDGPTGPYSLSLPVQVVKTN